jgi:hypothetical protein
VAKKKSTAPPKGASKSNTPAKPSPAKTQSAAQPAAVPSKQPQAATTRKPVQEKTPTPVATPAPAFFDDTKTNERLKKAFFLSLGAMLLIFWITGFNVGFHQDEMDMNAYGKTNYAFYLSGGKDTSFMGTPGHINGGIDTALKYYGSAFEYLAVGINKITGLEKGPQEFNVRHIVNQLFAVLGILFTGLIAFKAGGWRAALFASWLVFLTPTIFGSSLFNTKDIPFLAGYVASLYYIIGFVQELPSPTWKTSLSLMFAFAFTTGTRIGGILLLFYLFILLAGFLLTNRPLLRDSMSNFKNIFLKLLAIVGGGMALVVVTWPYVLRNPIKNLLITFGVVKKFPVRIKLAFDGEVIDSLNIPPHYLPKFMAITIPLFILACVVVGILIVLYKYKRYDWRVTGMILFASIFPVFYAIISKVALYSAWRHFLFVYPGLCAIAGIGMGDIFSNFKKPVWQYAFAAVALLCMIRPIAWCVENHPYEYAYFNELGGGFKDAYYRYETDYWEITAMRAADWLMQNEPIRNTPDSVNVVSNTDVFLRYYIGRHYPGAKIRVLFSGCLPRSAVDWHYGVFNTLFLEPNFLEDCFPPCGTVHTIDIDGMPVTAILKDTTRYDYLGVKQFEKQDFRAADSLFNLYTRLSCNNNVGLLGLQCFARAAILHSQEAIQLGEKGLQYNVKDYYALCGIGAAYGDQGMYEKGLSYLNRAVEVKPNEQLARIIIDNLNKRRATMGANPANPGNRQP